MDRRIVLDLILALALTAAAILGITRYVAVPWTVDGESMEPALSAGDRVIDSLRKPRFQKTCHRLKA